MKGIGSVRWSLLLLPLCAQAQTQTPQPPLSSGAAAPAPAGPAQPMQYVLRDGTIVQGVPLSEDASTVTVQTPTGPVTMYKMNIQFIRPALGAPAPAPPGPPPAGFTGPPAPYAGPPQYPPPGYAGPPPSGYVAPPPYAPMRGFASPPPPLVRARGFEFELAAGFGSFFDNSMCFSAEICSRENANTNLFAAGPGLQLRGGYRPSRPAGFGLRFGYQTLANNDRTTSRRGSLSTLALGVYARFYPLPIRRERGPEISFSLGFDFYSRFSADWPATTTAMTYSAYRNIQAFSFPVDVAFHYYVVKGLALGGAVAMALWLPTSECGNSLAGTERCTSDGLRFGVSWFIGTTLRYSVFM